MEKFLEKSRGYLCYSIETDWINKTAYVLGDDVLW